MVEQGLTIMVRPVAGGPYRYEVSLQSTGWEDRECVVFRHVLTAEFDGLPKDVSSREFSEWIDTILGLSCASIRRHMRVTDFATISSAKEDPQGASGTPSQGM